eukprot:474571-Prymnesium_polylepis.1
MPRETWPRRHAASCWPGHTDFFSDICIAARAGSRPTSICDNTFWGAGRWSQSFCLSGWMERGADQEVRAARHW